MEAGKPRILAGRGAFGRGVGRGVVGWGLAAVSVAVLAGACGGGSSSPVNTAQPSVPATPTVTPSTVPVLGKLSFGTFPSTWDGTRALMLCEQWSGLRGEYVPHLRHDTPYELEQWFSSNDWQAAFIANSPLRNDPAYSNINTAFGLVSTAEAASIANAKWLDRGCAAAD
jgi:hypothetical protein